MTETAHLELKVTSNGVREATTGLRNLESTGERTQNRMRSLGAVMSGTFAGLSIVGGITAIVRSTIEAENAAAQLEARLKSTGNQVNMTKAELLGMASALQGVTIFDDEAIAGAEAMLLTFTRISGQAFPQALEAILNVSTAMGTDLNSAALQVGKALNDPIKGLGALARAGIQFTVAQKETIKSLVETGRTAEAQTVILSELETQMGGAARAARDTLGGSLVGLKNDFMDLLEGDTGTDGVRGTRDAIDALAKQMRDPATKEAFQSLAQTILGLAGSFASVITSANEAFTATQRWLTLKMGGSTQVGDLAQIRHDIDATAAKYEKLQDLAAKGQGGPLIKSLLSGTKIQLDKLKTLEKDHIGLFGTPEENSPEARTKRQREKAQLSVSPYDQKKPLPRDNYGALAGEDGDDGPSKKAAKTAAKAIERAAENRAEDFARLKESLLSAEDAIAASYAAREAIITASAVRGSEEEKELRAKSLAERDAQLQQIKNQKNAEINALRASLLTEEESIRESYARRMAIVAENTTPGEDQAALQAKLTAQRDLELGELALTQQAKHDQILEFMLTEEENRLASHAREMEQLKLDEQAKLISHEEFLLAKKRLEEIHAEELAQIARDKNSAALASYGSMFQDLGTMFAAFGGKQSKAAKAAFAVSKALAIAQSIMNIQVAISEAMKQPYPMNIAAMSTVVAEGASIVGNIQSIAYGGAHDKGGRIPAGKVGIVGEKGMEFVEGPANVTSRTQTKRMLDKASSDTGGVTAAAPVVHINTTITNTGSETRSSASDEKDARDLAHLIDNRVRETLQKEERQGGILWKRRNGG